MSAPSESGTRWPTTREEAWRYFPTRALQGFALDQAPAPGTGELAVVGAVPDGVMVRAAKDVGDALPLPMDGLTEANHRYATALVIEVGAGVRVPALEVVHRMRGDGVAHPRLVLKLGAHADVSLFQRFEGDGAGFVNAATAVTLEPGARLRMTKLEAEAPETSHVESVRVLVGRDARFDGFTLSLGAARARTAPSIVLAAPGAEAEVDGLYLGRGEQVLDHTAVILHAAPQTTSRATWAGVLDGKSTGTFQGLVTMAAGAVTAKTRQLTRTLLLSPTAVANAKPELHIDVDDVEASHGAAIGSLDAGQLFYLASRGVGPDEARRMLIGAFVRATLELAPAAFRPALEAALAGHVAFAADPVEDADAVPGDDDDAL
ncbi:MAG: SufD family Fe-S cluster assembly protein [Myxococcota bacterium]